MSLHHPTDDLSALLQLPDLPDWDFGTDLTTTDLTLPCYTFRDAQLPLVRDEQRFLELLSDRSDSKPSGAAPGALWPGVQDWCTQQGASKTGSGTSSEEPTHSIKQRNKQAQRKCRLRKKEREREAEERVAELGRAVRKLEIQKQFLERSNLLLSAAAKEAIQGQTLPAVCVAAEVVHDWDPRATLHLQEAWPETIQLRPAQIVAITPEYLAKLWQGLAAAMVLHLPLAKRPGNPVALNKVQALCREHWTLCRALALGNPSTLYSFLTQPYMPGNRAVYQALVADLDASPQQAQRVQALLQEHKAAMAQLQVSEQRLLSAIQGRSHKAQAGAGDVLPAMLQSVCQDAMRVTFQLHAQVWSTCMTPLQLATCIVRTAPSCPDATCIAEILAEQVS